MTRLVLKYPREGLGKEVCYVAGKNCDSVERAEGGGFWLRIGDSEHFVADQDVQAMQRSGLTCPGCTELFPSAHALKTHRGMKKH